MGVPVRRSGTKDAEEGSAGGGTLRLIAFADSAGTTMAKHATHAKWNIACLGVTS
jgi:hypothetical protein